MSVLMKNGNNYTGSTSGGGGATSLNGLSDVEVSSPSNGQVLSYDSSTAKWENGSVPIASANTVGGIKVGQNLTIQSDGTLNATGGSGGGSSYSTSEQVIGTWINGENIYQKTFSGTTSSSSPTTVGSIGSSSSVIEMKGICSYDSAYNTKNCEIIPFYGTDTTYWIDAYLENGSIMCNTGSNMRNRKYYLTVRYIK